MGIQPNRRLCKTALLILLLFSGTVSCGRTGFSVDDPLVPANCEDGFANQNELMQDCGGVCEPCLLPAILVDHVRGGAYADSPRDDNFAAKNGVFGNIDYYRIAYLKFDLTAIASDATIARAAVHLEVDTGPSGEHPWLISEVVDGNGWVDNNWDQNITWNTRPADGQTHTPDGQTTYAVDIMAGPVALRPERVDPGRFYGLSFYPAQPADVWTGDSGAEAFLLELK